LTAKISSAKFKHFWIAKREN